MAHITILLQTLLVKELKGEAESHLSLSKAAQQSMERYNFSNLD